ncbi:MAG: acyltransferase [Okeania sp. SIO2F4]|uniref:acyltransferase n=1 Tax=Okeania sp. SIO2F4 TaxID=2607790 RepID=UPI001428F97A|nr:DapH/DapD/GlmU-related protein [Okeania sp. SIO2F4]NES08035.1 acyltransferase [Okeania sp. SIO2F4]
MGLKLGWREPLFIWMANSLPRTHISDAKLRAKMLALAGVRVEQNLRIFEKVEIRPIGGAKRINIGNGTFINSGVRFSAEGDATITIGKRVEIGPRCAFETRTHSVDIFDGHRTGENKSIVIEDNVWLGAWVIVLPGITIGNGSVVAAGAIVHRDVPPFTLVGGVPAKFIKEVKNHITQSD